MYILICDCNDNRLFMPGNLVSLLHYVRNARLSALGAWTISRPNKTIAFGRDMDGLYQGHNFVVQLP